MVRAVIYARFSSDNQRDESIDAQIRAISEYAKKNEIVIVGEYIDKARSAMTDNRPEFLRMILEASEQKFDIVLVHKLDRFARNRQDSIGYRMQLKRHGVSLVSVLEYIDESPESIILESVLEAMAEYYSKNLAREVQKGMKENALKGLHTGGKPPFGYDVDPETKKLVINEKEACAVRLIFDRFLEGYGYDKIMNELNVHGYRTKCGNPFGKNSLHGIVRNEKYTGTYIFNRSAAKDVDGKRNNHKNKEDDEIIRLDDAVPAIISKNIFEQ
ncbi:MAG TPA: recombinase family protein, partial [Clostridiales bacterium]|nr:recombinase family protein [Clostridiales bacterium]